MLTVALTLNLQFEPPLPVDEVEGIAKSVERYRARWTFYTPEQRTLWGQERGLRSGKARRKGTPLENDRQPWVAAGVSRKTWYRNFRYDTELHR